MADHASFTLRMTGGTAEYHQFEAYDGFVSLAGAARTLTLATNYVETGAIRQRGEYVGRHLVRALPMREGSLIAQFTVTLASSPAEVFGIAASISPSQLLYGLVHRMVSRNVGLPSNPLNDDISRVLEKRPGDVEKLVGISEPPLERAHDIIGNGVEDVEWVAGFDSIANFNRESKAYIKQTVYDPEVLHDDFTVTGFYGISGNGSVWDENLGHNVAISMDRETLRSVGKIFSWGLDQYTNNTGLQVRIAFSRNLSVDGRVKKYIIHSADYAQL